MKTKKTTVKKASVKKVAAKKVAVKKVNKKAPLKKPADRKSAPRTRIEAVISKKERNLLQKYVKAKKITVTQLIKNWLKSLLK